MTKEEIVRKCAKQAGFVIGQHGYGMIEHAVNLAWDAALASRADVQGEYICKCGVRVEPHRCATGTEF